MTGPSPALAKLFTEQSQCDAAVDQHQREFLSGPAEAGQDEVRRAHMRENDRLNDVWVDAMDAIATFPAATAVDLHAKLVFMIENKMGGSVDWLPTLLADVERLAAEQAA